jgi:hypothetical protein
MIVIAAEQAVIGDIVESTGKSPALTGRMEDLGRPQQGKGKNLGSLGFTV